MPNNKSPGPDGFSAEFCKDFWNILAPIFIQLTIDIKQKSKLPKEMNTTLISFILKPGKDPTFPLSYRPVSLINTDIKNYQ